MTIHGTHAEPAQAAANARIAGIVLVAATLLSILMMAHHPSVGAHDAAAAVAEMSAKADLSRIVHGVLIALIGAEFFAFLVLCDRLGAGRNVVRAGLVAYAIGTGAMIGAALISGFVISALASHYDGLSAADAATFVDLSRLSMAGNQALAKLGVLAMSAAIIAWSIALLRDRTNRWLAVVGFIAGAAPAVALLAGAIRLDVVGMTIVVLCQAVWNVFAGVQLIRAKI
ncbi:MAG TPA: hypothetical protein VLK83_03150 [Rhodanobacteraceae bacterium]|nr:hypothetical protein [Rhodanobacteraceae bacterium]